MYSDITVDNIMETIANNMYGYFGDTKKIYAIEVNEQNFKEIVLTPVQYVMLLLYDKGTFTVVVYRRLSTVVYRRLNTVVYRRLNTVVYRRLNTVVYRRLSTVVYRRLNTYMMRGRSEIDLNQRKEGRKCFI